MSAWRLWLSMAGAASPAFDGPPPELALQDAELEQLRGGETVLRQELGRSGSNGTAMALVDASVDECWGVILDVDRYVDFLPYITASWLAQDDPSDLRWGFELTTRGVVTRYAGFGVLHRDEGYMAWETRPVGNSPLKASRGWWQVLPLEGRTLLVYTADVQTAWWLPTWTHEQAAGRGLPTLVELVGRRAAATG